MKPFHKAENTGKCRHNHVAEKYQKYQRLAKKMLAVQEDKSILDLIAKNIRQERLKNHLSQEALADLSNVHRTYIGMLERSEKNVTVLSLSKIASALNVSIDTFLKKMGRK